MSLLARIAGWLVVVSSAVPGCSGDGASGQGACTASVSSSCPGSPGFQARILPIFQRGCVACHAPGGREASRPLTTHGEIFPRRSSVLSQLASCAMPPPDGAPISDADRKLVLDWLVCGAPDD